MNSLAALHLRQARAFLYAGDRQRAVELVEKARALAGDDPEVQRGILEVLAMARGDGRAAAQKAVEKSNRGWVVAAAVMLLLAGGVFIGWRKWWVAEVKPMRAPIVAQAAATLPSTRAIVTPERKVSIPRKTTVKVVETKPRVRPCVGLLVLLGRYQGIANGQHLEVDVPLGSGAAFVVRRAGVLLTAKHLTHLAQENNFPSTLRAAKLPTVTLRDISFVVCFGPSANDWIEAKLLYESQQFDVAVLQTDRQFAVALDGAGRQARSGETMAAWGYPAVLGDIFNNRFADQDRIGAMLQRLQDNQPVNLLSCFHAECFEAAEKSAVVSAAERNMEGEACVQFDGKIEAGYDGGPLVDASQNIIGMVDMALKMPGAGGHFAVLVAQLQDELAPYLEPPAK